MLRLASAVVADPKVALALDNPKLDTPAKESLLLSLCGDQLNGEGRNFVRVLVEGDRIALLPAIQAQFEALKDNTPTAWPRPHMIETAFPMADSDLAALTAALAKPGSAARSRRRSS